MIDQFTKTSQPTPCACCSETIEGQQYISPGIGIVCGDCGTGIRIGVRALNTAGITGIYLGKCGDNDAGSEAA